MSLIDIAPRHLERLAALDAAARRIDEEKTRTIFEAIGLDLAEADLARILEWPLITVAVPDRQMAVQLNKLSAYIPNLKFIADADSPLFALRQGKKGRRVWKER